MSLKFSRAWEMPNSRTFQMKEARNIIEKYLPEGCLSIDPFANKNRIAKITNDIDPECEAQHSLDAYDFLKTFAANTIDAVLFDPPYSSRQVSECYKAVGRTVNMETTQGRFWSKLKRQIATIVKPGGVVISFGWNSNGIGIVQGFELIEIKLISHGGVHNDTIIVVERKKQARLF